MTLAKAIDSAQGPILELRLEILRCRRETDPIWRKSNRAAIKMLGMRLRALETLVTHARKLSGHAAERRGR